MMVSPKAAEAAGREVRRQNPSAPVRSLRRADRAGRIVLGALSRTTGTGAESIFERIVYLPIVDATVRLANLRSGQLTLSSASRLGRANLKSDSRSRSPRCRDRATRASPSTSARSDLAQKKPTGKDARVREAFELSLDRDAIVKVAMEGEAQGGNQWWHRPTATTARAPRFPSATSSGRSSS